MGNSFLNEIFVILKVSMGITLKNISQISLKSFVLWEIRFSSEILVVLKVISMGIILKILRTEANTIKKFPFMGNLIEKVFFHGNFIL